MSFLFMIINFGKFLQNLDQRFTFRYSKQSIGQIQYWFVSLNQMVEKNKHGFPIISQYFYFKKFKSEPRSNIMSQILYQQIYISIFNRILIIKFFSIILTYLSRRVAFMASSFSFTREHILYCLLISQELIQRLK